MATHPNRNRANQKMAAAVTVAHNHEVDYSALLVGVRRSFERVTAGVKTLFLTNAEGLNDLYLDSLPTERQVHNCHACRRFLEIYGGLVAISEDGSLVPAMWDASAVPDFYREAFEVLHARVKKARVVSPFFSTQRVWGSPLTGDWSHMAATPPLEMVFRERALTAGQAMAAAKENFRTVATALVEFKPKMLDQALRVLEAGALARSEKFLGPVRWLRELQNRPKGRSGENVLWRAIAAAPEGYCHPKASVIGPMLDDIAAGLSFDEIKVRFNAKLTPLMNQRPPALPTEGNIKAAEALVAKLGIAPALARRFARIEEVPAVWRPREAEVPAHVGVFGHLTAKGESAPVVDLPAVTMTWDKFSRAVMPEAEKIEAMVPPHGAFLALTTSVDSEAPPILKWDRADERNPVAWYVYPIGSPAHQWGLRAGAWVPVTAVTSLPPMWGSRPSPFLGEGAVLLLEGCVDTRECGNALFPECLKDELHAVRTTIEAYSREASLDGRTEATACGYDIRKGSGRPGATLCKLRAFVSGGWNGYKIDRWD